MAIGTLIALAVLQTQPLGPRKVAVDTRKIADYVRMLRVPSAREPARYQIRRLPATGLIQVTVSPSAQFLVAPDSREVVDFIDYSVPALAAGPAQAKSQGAPALPEAVSRTIEGWLKPPASYRRTERRAVSGAQTEFTVLYREPMPYKAYDYYNYASYVYRSDLKRVTSFRRVTDVVFSGAKVGVSASEAARAAAGFKYVGLGYAHPGGAATFGPKRLRLTHVFEAGRERRFVDALTGRLVKSTDIPAKRM